MHGRKKICPAADGGEIGCYVVLSRGDTMFGIELLLRDLVFDGTQRGRFWVDLYPFCFQLLQRLGIYGFYLDRQGLEIFSKLVYIMKIPDIPFDKVMA